MKNRLCRTGTHLSALAVAAALCAAMPDPAVAQSAEGSIFGTAKGSTAVTIVNIDTGSTRDVKANADGSFTFTRLVPGRYRVTSGGVTREVAVAIGSGTQVNLSSDRVEVAGSRVLRSAIDVSTVESNTVFTQEQIQALPVPRSIESVALLAPGVVRGDAGLGSGTLPSFGGASVAENGYYINGFDVTNIRNFLSYAQLPFDAIAQQQIKTGGYGAEYGRSLGGVISLVTKRGTNEWKSGAAAYMSPKVLRSDGQNVLNQEPDANGGFRIFNAADTSQALSYNVYTGGPIIKDKLFIFALLEGRRNESVNYGLSQANVTRDTKPNGMIKLDFAPMDNHTFELTAIENKRRIDILDYTNAKDYSTRLDGTGAASQQRFGGTVGIAKYTGYLTDNLTVSALVGRVKDARPVTAGARTAGADCPTVLEGPNFADVFGCWAAPWPGQPGRDPLAPPDSDTRKAFRFDVEYTLKNHTIRAGIDNQRFDSAEAGGSPFSGGAYHLYRVFTAATNIAGQLVPANTPLVRTRLYNTTSGVYSVNNTAMYIEDAWKPTKNLLISAGVRSESFDNKNGAGQSFVKADNLLAPRMGAAWDVNGDASLKVFGNQGRYFIPVASNTNIRATRSESYTETWYTYQGRDPRTAGPLNIQQVGTVRTILDGRLPDPGTIADTKLSPMNQDELILGLQKALKPGLIGGVKSIYRRINSGMDDYCDHTRVAAWIKGNVNANYKDTLAPCMIVNPGRDLNIMVDINNDGKLVEQKIPAAALGLAAYERTYRGLEFSLERPFDGQWGLQASYTYAQSKGSAEGYVQSQLNQEDAGITQDFDFGSFTDGAFGYLPNDRRHVLKIFGNMAVAQNLRLGANATISSGRPRSCIGYVPPTVSDFAGASAYTSASSFYCLKSETEGAVLVPRGSAGRTPWTNQLDLQLAYNPVVSTGKLTLQVDIFNVFNSQKPIELEEVRDFSRATSIGAPYKLSANYGAPTAFQAPRSFRLAARYEF